MRRLLATAAPIALAAATVSAHANSVSYAQYAVDGRTLHAIVRLPLDDVDLRSLPGVCPRLHRGRRAAERRDAQLRRIRTLRRLSI